MTSRWKSCSEDICDKDDDDSIGNTIMCPSCDKRCDYFRLHESCYYSKITHVFDNPATVVFAALMGIWGQCTAYALISWFVSLVPLGAASGA